MASYDNGRDVVGYGADRKSRATYFALFGGAFLAVAIVLFAYGRFEAPPAKLDLYAATLKAAGKAGQERPGGNWDTRLN